MKLANNSCIICPKGDCELPKWNPKSWSEKRTSSAKMSVSQRILHREGPPPHRHTAINYFVNYKSDLTCNNYNIYTITLSKTIRHIVLNERLLRCY